MYSEFYVVTQEPARGLEVWTMNTDTISVFRYIVVSVFILSLKFIIAMDNYSMLKKLKVKTNVFIGLDDRAEGEVKTKGHML